LEIATRNNYLTKRHTSKHGESKHGGSIEKKATDGDAAPACPEDIYLQKNPFAEVEKSHDESRFTQPGEKDLKELPDALKD